MTQQIRKGDYVRLIRSTNPYVPVGTILHVTDLSQITDKSGVVQVFNVTWKGHKYHVHRDYIKKANFVEPEKVAFS